jgi:2-keto-4-pentenoate hydratase/2-oxohepta-3-ene-1,7-dioic acid hydratase in catechol pathway
MKLGTFRVSADENFRPGAFLVDLDAVIDLSPAVGSMSELIAGGADALRTCQELIDGGATLAMAGIEIGPALQPASLRDFIGFEDHAAAGAKRRGEQLSASWKERPFYYKGNHRTIVANGQPVAKPSFTSELDFELEVACVIGKPIIDAGEDVARDAIFGFTIMNDWSARDVQRAEMASRLGPSKSKDFATSLGPWIVTVDECGDDPAFTMEARLNGESVCRAAFSDLYWTFAKTIAFVSQGEAVLPGDVFGSGTPFGGCMLDHGGPWLQSGDTVELEVAGIGVLRNSVA